MKFQSKILAWIKQNGDQLYKNLVSIAKKYDGNELINKINILVNYYFNIGKEEFFNDIMLPELRNEVQKLSEILHSGIKDEEIEIVTPKESKIEKKTEKKGLFKHGSYNWLGDYRINEMKAFLKSRFQDELKNLKITPDKMEQDIKNLMLDTFHGCYLLATETKRGMDKREQRFIKPLSEDNNIRDNTIGDELLSKRISSNLFARILKTLDEESEIQDKVDNLKNKQQQKKEDREQQEQEQKDLQQKKKEMKEKKDESQSQKEKNNIQKQIDQNEQEQQENQQKQQQTKQQQKDIEQNLDQAEQQLDQKQQKDNQQFMAACNEAEGEAKEGKQIKAMLSLTGGKKAGDESIINEIREEFLDRNTLKKYNVSKFVEIIKSTKFLDIDMKNYKNDVFGTTSGVTIGDDIKEVLVDELLSDDWQFYLNYIENNLLQSEMKASSIPSDYIVLIDVSGSMDTSEKTTVSRAVAYWFMLKTIKEKGNAFLWFFNASPVGSEPISFKKDKKEFLSRLFGTVPGGGTDISAILRATTRFISTSEEFKLKRNKEVILISDNESSISTSVLQNKNFKLHVIAVGGKGSAFNTLKEFTEDKKIFMLDEANKLLKAFKD